MAAPATPTTAPRPWLAGLAAGGLVGFLARDLDLPALVSYWGDRTLLILVAGGVGALLAATRFRRLLAALTFALAFVWVVVAYTPAARILADGLVRRDPEQDADAVFVLASDIQTDGELTTAAEARLLHGLELIGQGRTSRLVLSELHPPKRSYAAAARVLIGHLALAPEVLVVGPVATTRDEAVAVGRLAHERGFGRLLVVTSPLHSRRACAALEHEGVVVVSSPASETRYDLESLDRPGARLLAFGGALHERVGLFVYARRGWLTLR